eukprot:TRINITY_DN16546_c0_g2_i1.p1 TRINITY_DN16546_c0_g2~~TRINITY_DN16546_c0_g2_i1.p1  ORF type:complete len:1149 (+),score=206.79 TRINITY_DN16546_c0_g2_i1:200-3646(+)
MNMNFSAAVRVWSLFLLLSGLGEVFLVTARDASNSSGSVIHVGAALAAAAPQEAQAAGMSIPTPYQEMLRLSILQYVDQPTNAGERQLVDLKRENPEEFQLVLARFMIQSRTFKPPERNVNMDALLILTCLMVFVVAVGLLPKRQPALQMRTIRGGAAAEKLPAAAGRLQSTGELSNGGLTGPAFPELSDAIARKETVASLVEVMAEKRPLAVALVDAVDGASMNYKQMLRNVTSLANAMTRAGLRSGDVVVVFLPPSPALVVALLAVSKAAVVWCTLEAETPGPRLQQLVCATGARLALMAETQQPVEALPDLPVWSLGQFGEVLGEEALLPAPRGLPADRPPAAGTACIFFTSGSTGVPKGVMYSHAMMLQGVMSTMRLCCMGPSTVALLKITTVWAVLEWEAFPALLAGGTVVCDSRSQKDLTRFAEVIAERGINVCLSSAPVMKALCEVTWAQNEALLQGALGSVQHILSVGGALPLDVAAQTQEMLPATKIHNVYGCTESCCTEWTYFPTPQTGNAPAGRPQPLTEVYILDSTMKALPAGEVGEIYIGSAYNALGYLGDEELSKARFPCSPWYAGHTLYKTGDIGALLPDHDDGALVLNITGRADRQLNINGVRVAPEEVETAIREVSGVLEVVVVQGGQYIVAFFRSQDEDLDGRIKAHCAERLYTRMRPELFIRMVEFPRLANGKPNLKALEAQAKDAVSDRMVQAVDSLGMMKNVSKDALREMTALSAMRGLAMSAVIAYHLFWGHFIFMFCSNLVSTEFDTFIPNGPIRWFVRGILQSQWSMFGFALMSARTDRQGLEEGKPGWWRETVMVYCMFAFMHWPLGDLVQLSNDALSNDVIVPNGAGGPRWYFKFWVICRLLSLALLRIDRVLYNLGAGGCLLRCAIVSGLLARLMLKDIEVNPAWCPHDEALRRACKQFNIVGLLLPMEGIMYVVYIVGFLYGKQVSAAVWQMWPKRCGAALPLALFVAGATLVGAADEEYNPIWMWFQDVLREMPIDTLLFAFLMIALYMAAEGPWLKRCGLVEIGNASLGGYVIHFFFLSYMIDKAQLSSTFRIGVLGLELPSIDVAMLSVRSTLGSLGMLIVLLLYLHVFGLTISVLFQKVFLATFAAVEKGVVRICSTVASAWQALMLPAQKHRKKM